MATIQVRHRNHVSRYARRVQTTGRMVCVEIGVGLDRGLGLSWDQYRELGRHAARLGYQSVWTNAANGRDSMHVCAQWSVATADVVPGGIGTGVSVIPIGYWSPASLASEAATVGEISGGKFVLGVGSGAIGNPAFRRSLGLDDGPAADRHDARVAGDVARPAGRRDGRAPGQGHHAARRQPRVGAAEGARGAGCPRPENADAGRRGVRRCGPELVHARAGGRQPRDRGGGCAGGRARSRARSP